MFKLGSQNSNNFNTNFGGIGVKSVIPVNVFGLVMPIITVKENCHIQTWDKRIRNKLTDSILLNVTESHQVKQLIAQQFEFIMSTVLKSALNGTTFNICSNKGRLDLSLIATVGTCHRNPFALFVFPQTPIGAKVSLFKLTGCFVGNISAVIAGNHFASLEGLYPSFDRMSSRASCTTIIPLSISYQGLFMVNLFSTMIAGYFYTCKFGAVFPTAGRVMARLRAKLGIFLARMYVKYLSTMTTSFFYHR